MTFGLKFSLMISDLLLLFSSGILGIFLGAQITEACLFVPYWKELPPDEFFALHKSFGKQIHAFFAPLTIVATFLPLVTVAYLLVIGTSQRPLLVMIGISTCMFFSTYFLYFKKANKSFADRSISNASLPAKLVKWGNWHWGRVVLESIAFAGSLFLLLVL